MISKDIDRVVNAVLYEGYILYPYRTSIKNRQRWTFGGLYPESYCKAQHGADASANQTECLIRGSPETGLDVTVRFLHLTERTVGAVAFPSNGSTGDSGFEFRPVESLQLGDCIYRGWQEAEEREFELPGLLLSELTKMPEVLEFSWPNRRWVETLHGDTGGVLGALTRVQRAIVGTITVSAVQCAQGLFKISVQVANRTSLDFSNALDRDEALVRALVSSHTVLQTIGGEFVSLIDPPPDCGDWAAGCKNEGVWPVLVGRTGSCDAMLASPIILSDYPQIADESPGDLFDGTEIDEILTLRILTLTDEEKREAAALDERSRRLLTRTEALAREQLAGLHGVMREQPIAGGPTT
jgi:hydrogenase maturation protease